MDGDDPTSQACAKAIWAASWIILSCSLVRGLDSNIGGDGAAVTLPAAAAVSEEELLSSSPNTTTARNESQTP
eukprot:scaffold2482_cov166-Amphora_coffeaeformis.AAC.16